MVTEPSKYQRLTKRQLANALPALYARGFRTEQTINRKRSRSSTQPPGFVPTHYPVNKISTKNRNDSPGSLMGGFHDS